MKSICVFCGANPGNQRIFSEVTTQLGATLAKMNIETIYGAGKVGLMGVLAEAVLNNQGKITGVIPDFLKKMEVCHEGLTRLFVVETMHQRKQKMAELSEGFFILPGGFGTLDEMFEILTWKQLRLHQKPIGLLNLNGYYDHLIGHIDQMTKAGFLRKENLDLLLIEDDMDALLDKMRHYKSTPVADKWLEKS